jgi:pimeloyl-ACP methyl ester carboxylesterase
MEPQEMLDEGMVRAVRQRRLAVDVVIADAHLGYVYDGSMLRRLHEEVVLPARARGVHRVWLAGISLGGYVAMGYALRNPGLVEGVVTLAPYLGRRPLVQAVADAGGAGAWRRTAQPRDEHDIDHDLWMWLSQRPPDAPALYLGYGVADRFAQGHALMAQTLPSSHVQTAPGGHDWPPWRALWSQWLDRGLWPQSCA